MTDRLTDAEIKALRVQVLGYHSLRDVLRALDEIEERRRAEQRLLGVDWAVKGAELSVRIERKDGGA